MTSDDVIFARIAAREGITESDEAKAQGAYFETGRACLLASPLTKQYGWGIHHDGEGRVALVAVESEEYANLMADGNVKKVQTMRRLRR